MGVRKYRYKPGPRTGQRGVVTSGKQNRPWALDQSNLAYFGQTYHLRAHTEAGVALSRLTSSLGGKTPRLLQGQVKELKKQSTA